MARGGTRGRHRNSDSEDQLVELIGAIYDAALAPQQLPQVLERLGRLCGAIWMPMSIVPVGAGNVHSLQNSTGDPGILEFFCQNYNTPEASPSIPHLMVLPSGKAFPRELGYSDAEWERFSLYQEVYRPLEVYASLGAMLLRSEHHFVPLGILRAKSQGPFEARELQLLDRAIPHLQRALQIILRLNALDAKQAAGEQLWDRLPVGVFLLDEGGRILWTNRAGEAIAAGNDGLTTRDGLLQAARADENAKLNRLIRESALTTTARGVASGGGLALPRPSMRRALAVLVSPFRVDRTQHMLLSRRPAVVVMVSDPEAKPRRAPELLAQLYDLTAREAELVTLLLHGIDLRGAADQLQLSMNTVRTHLRGVFDKTGTRRQAELVALLLRTVATLDRAD